MYIAEGELGYRLGPPIKLIADFHPKAAQVFYETPISVDQQLLEVVGGKICLVATVPDTRQISAWLRSFGDDISVIEPLPFLHI